MAKQDVNAILAAEADRPAGEHLFRCLSPLGQRVFLATSVEELLEMLRRQVFHRAVVAVELAIDGQPVLARLSRLSALRYLAAVGPAGRPALERKARLAGASLYVARPVTTELLAKALGLLGTEARRGPGPPP